MSTLMRVRGWVFVTGAVCGMALTGLGRLADAQEKKPEEPRSQKDIVTQILRDFVKACEENNVENALKCFPSEEDLKAIMPEAGAARSASELRSHIKLQFAEFAGALKDFGKHDLVEVNPGKIRQMRKGEQGVKVDTLVLEGGHVAFAKDTNYFIELRFNFGGILRVAPERWVITSMITRIERFPTIDSASGGG